MNPTPGSDTTAEIGVPRASAWAPSAAMQPTCTARFVPMRLSLSAPISPNGGHQTAAPDSRDPHPVPERIDVRIASTRKRLEASLVKIPHQLFRILAISAMDLDD